MCYLHVTVVNNIGKMVSWKAVTFHDDWETVHDFDPALTIDYVHVFDLLGFVGVESDDVGFAIGCAFVGF